MLFNSYAFLLVFLPGSILICGLVDAHPRLRTWVLIALSMIFYAYWDVRFLPLMVGSILVNWWAAQLYTSTRRHAIITAAIASNLLVLAIFKYNNFFAENFSALLGVKIDPLSVALPLGISFFTFHHIMYLVDLGRGKAPAFPLDRYALYICFFPQVLAGPLVRWYEVIHQFGKAIFVPGWEARFALGLTFIVVGLAQKVFLGDGLATNVNSFYERASIGDIGQVEAWLAVLSFSFQIFFDFSGYTDVAIGAALLFGIELPPNFNSPYRATSVREFWRRWHMTLSRFLRDYLYVPLGGNRHGLPRQVVALLLTMGLGGLWHGAGWLFIVWGFLHGIALATDLIWRHTGLRMPSALGWAVTFLFVTIAWVFFRAPSFEMAMRVLEALVAGGASWSFQGWRILVIAAVCAILLPSSNVICRKLAGEPRWPVALALGAASAAIVVGLGSDRTYEFIYFQF
jgi:alginate O-acetyltransferase complex protein AlgI